jgi:hypothetical protein
MYKADEPGVFIIPCFSAHSAMDNISNQPILKKGGQAQHLAFLPVLVTLEKARVFKDLVSYIM